MKSLLVMRHAKSSWDNQYLADHDRPLNERGKRDARRMGELLKQLDLLPDLIISSTAERARNTAERFVLAADYERDLRLTRNFYHADPEDYLQYLRELGVEFDCVMLIGHNPGMAELVYDLTGVDTRFTTANIAHITLPLGNWADLQESTQGELHHLWRPKELD